MIKPTVGRVVLFQPHKPIEQPLLDQPYAATIAYVWGDRMVNLSWVDHNGRPGASTSVTLLQDDDVGNQSGHFAYWMPYQVGQAAKVAREGAVPEHGIEVGDAVRLRSGGPVMVAILVEGERVKCCWFGDQVIVSDWFHPATLDTVLKYRSAKAEDGPGTSGPKEASATGATPKNSEMRNLRIVSDGRITRVYDFESGAEVKLVQSLRLEHHKGGRMYARVETIERAESFDIVADCEVRSVVPGAVPAAGPVWSASEFRVEADPVLTERGASEGLAVV